MSSLYRCKVRVAYKPVGSEEIILFDEKNVVDANLKNKYVSGRGPDNLQGSNNIPMGLTKSTVQVTLSDPYMTGITWPVVSDAAKFYTATNVAVSSNVLLPTCKEGEDPFKNKCVRYYDPLELNIEAPLKNSGVLDAPILFVGLWYDIKGVSFGTTFSYRVNKFQVVHGKKFPEISISGEDLLSTTLNQDYHNISFPEGTTIEQAVKIITDKAGFNAKLCNANYSDQRIIPEYKRLKNQTLGEMLESLLKSVNGDMVYLPTTEFTKNVSICTRSRAEVTKGCYIFYLGKGLYEGYEIEAAFQPNKLTNSLQQPDSIDSSKESGVSEDFSSNSYTLDAEIVKGPTRQSRFANVQKVAFPGQFEVKNIKRFADGQTVTDKIWQESGPIVQTKTGKDINLYGINPTGGLGISFLDGRVLEANPASGEVSILTNYLIKFCRNNVENKCFQAKIIQEIKGLEVVSAYSGTGVYVGQVVGSSGKEIFTRFIIKSSSDNQTITLNPKLVWDYAFPEDNRPAPGATVEQTNAAQVSSLPPGAPPAPELPPPNASSAPAANYVPKKKCTKAYFGQTGRVSNGDPTNWIHTHLDAYSGGKEGVEKDGLLLIRGLLNQGTRVLVGSGSTPEVPRSASDQEILEFIRRGQAAHAHSGRYAVDIWAPPGTAFPFCLEDISDPTQGGAGGVRDGINGLLPNGSYAGHLDPKSLSGEEAPVAAQVGGFGANSDRASQFQGSANTGISIQTEFIGVPRALRIVPGRTFLSFVTRWDQWVEAGGHRGVKTNIDPGVWITKKYSVARIDEVEYKWENGNLRVGLKAVSAWGYLGTNGSSIPDFDTYLSINKQRNTGEFSDFTNGYLDYIRSAGSLCYPLSTGGDSCREGGCTEIDAVEAFLQPPSEQTQPGNNTPSPEGSYPPANCRYTGTKYPADRVNAIINAAKAAGVNSKAGFAGIVGNALVESGVALSPTAENPSSRAYGVFQWLGGRRQGLERFAASQGRSASDFNVQMERFVQELKGADFAGPDTVQRLNSITDPATAAFEFNRLFERAPGQKETERQNNAREIFSQLTCDV